MPTVTVASPQGKWLLAGRPGIDFRQEQIFSFSHHVSRSRGFLSQKYAIIYGSVGFQQNRIRGIFFTYCVKQIPFERLVVINLMKTLPRFMKWIQPTFLALLLEGLLMSSFMPLSGMCYILFTFSDYYFIFLMSCMITACLLHLILFVPVPL